MSSALAIYVRFHDGRYHGDGDWPPSPARLFQALVAGAALSGPLQKNTRDALEWLEKMKPPSIGSPHARRGQRVMFYMPNNDMDSVGGDPRRTARIRTAKKFFSPWLFDAEIPFVYIWEGLSDVDRYSAGEVVSLADSLYQLGRGIDMAWAWADFLDASEVDALVASYPGHIERPSGGGNDNTLFCPQEGSLQSIDARYQAYHRRFKVQRNGRTVTQVFQQAPRPLFRPVAYDNAPAQSLFELRDPDDQAFAPWPLSRASQIVVHLRDAAVERLKAAFPARHSEIERVLMGRRPDGANAGSPAERVRIVPLPSIGQTHADRAIRRVLVETPALCSLRADDVRWSFSGLEPIDTETGEVYPIVLTPVADDGMLRHYGIDTDARIWRTVTPAALPQPAARRRIDPARKTAEAKAGDERRQEQQRAAAAVVQALRHAEVSAQVEAIRIQREPFEINGERVEAFASGTRFQKERLWHVEVIFAEPVSGPLVIGNGRFLGLGVMAPLRTVRGIHVFSIEAGLAEKAEPIVTARALRRAVMSLVQETLGTAEPLSAFFSGHERNGTPAKSEHPHLAFALDPPQRRLLIVGPHILERREVTHDERKELETLDLALRGFDELRAGIAGSLKVRPVLPDMHTDVLFAASRLWESVTPYQVTRHAKRMSAYEALAFDLRAECRRRGFPDPQVTVLSCRGTSGSGLAGYARLTFEVAVSGPVLLGRGRHFGLGLFKRTMKA